MPEYQEQVLLYKAVAIVLGKELAAYGILWDTPRASGYSHLHLTFVL